MVHYKKCSYKGCSWSAWQPSGTSGTDQKPFCIFHSPLIDMKEKVFKEAWEAFLNNSSAGSKTIESLECAGFIFPGQVNLSSLDVSGKADFSNALFVRDASFENIRFAQADFTGVRFAGDALFNKAFFIWFAKFDHAGFSGKASFVKSQFLLPPMFSHAHFTGQANFRKTHFTSARFDHACFLDDVDFSRAVFIDEADFRCVHFNGKALFTKTRFHTEAVFDDARFSGFGYFSDMNFSGRSISFGHRAPGIAANRSKTARFLFSPYYSLARTWNTIQRWRLRYKSYPV
ncbi:pentapeptide repeat-containing protein [bacterium]|nr:pentapeptide repeat-containing protein [bacterium]